MSWAKRALALGAIPPMPSARLSARPQASSDGLPINIDITPAIRVLESSRTAIGMTAHTALRMLAVEMAGALATSTRVSAKTRPIVTRNRSNKNKLTNKAEARTYFAKGFSNGKPYFKRIFADSPAEARNHPLAQIKRRGLARQAWFWIIGALGDSAGASDYKGAPTPSAYNITRDDAQLSIRMTSRLRYADQAFYRKGRATVENAGERVVGRVKRRLHYLAQLSRENAGLA